MSQRRRRMICAPRLQLLTAMVFGIIFKGSLAFLIGPHATGAGRRSDPMRRKGGTASKSRTLAKPSVVIVEANNEDAATAATGGNGHKSGAGRSTSSGSTSTCRNCKQQFRRDENTEDACSFHPGLFSGRLNRINDIDTSGLEYFWSCCGQSEKSHPGCVTSSHASYDDPAEGGDGAWRSPLTSTLR